MSDGGPNIALIIVLGIGIWLLVGVVLGIRRQNARPDPVKPLWGESPGPGGPVPGWVWLIGPAWALSLLVARAIGGLPTSAEPEATMPTPQENREPTPPAPAPTPAGSPAGRPVPVVDPGPGDGRLVEDEVTPCTHAALGIPAAQLETLRARNDAFVDALAGAELHAGHWLGFQDLMLEILELKPAPVARVTATTQLRIRAVDGPVLVCRECATVPEVGDAFCVGCGASFPVLQLAAPT